MRSTTFHHCQSVYCEGAHDQDLAAVNRTKGTAMGEGMGEGMAVNGHWREEAMKLVSFKATKLARLAEKPVSLFSRNEESCSSHGKTTLYDISSLQTTTGPRPTSKASKRPDGD